MTLSLPLAVTMGEPAGVGGELTLKAWLARNAASRPFLALDDPARLAALARDLGLEVAIREIGRPAEATAADAPAPAITLGSTTASLEMRATEASAESFVMSAPLRRAVMRLNVAFSPRMTAPRNFIKACLIVARYPGRAVMITRCVP